MSWRQYDNIFDDLTNVLFKASLAPIFRSINSSRALNKSGVLPKRIIICGSPRSGTTLMNELMRSYYGTYVMNREERALRFPYLVSNKKYVVTKHPLDFNFFSRFIETFNRPLFLFMLRDPRDVIISKHFKNKDHYLVNFPLWKKAVTAYENLDYDNIVLVKYENLITDPLSIQKKITAKLGLELKNDFKDFFNNVDKGHQDIKSLGGIRPIDSSNLGKYKNPEHSQRIREQITSFPEMSDYLIKYGYESSKHWETTFTGDS